MVWLMSGYSMLIGSNRISTKDRWSNFSRKTSYQFMFLLTFCKSLLRQAEILLDILTVTIDITILCTLNVSIWWIILILIRVSIEISEATKTLRQNFYPFPGSCLPYCSHAQFQYKLVITRTRKPEFLVEIGSWITTITTVWKRNCYNLIEDILWMNYDNYNFTEIGREVGGS